MDTKHVRFYSRYVISLGSDNKVINEGEKLHFTLRLNPNPPNPSSFYAPPEPTLPWPPSHTISQLFESPPLSLSHCLSHTHTDQHRCPNTNIKNSTNQILQSFIIDFLSFSAPTVYGLNRLNIKGANLDS